MIKKFISGAIEIIKIIAISLAIIIPIRYYVIQPFYVKGASMEPTFYDHEYLIIDEISYRFNQPQRGDIVVFKYPRDPKEYFIKRIIGLPGEKITFKDGSVFIYNNEHPEGFVLPEEYLSSDLQTLASNDETINLSRDEFYVLGDNRNASKDSRSFGPVNKSFLIGKVLFRGFPFNRVTIFHAPQYIY
jgi:signal peptidase I